MWIFLNFLHFQIRSYYPSVSSYLLITLMTSVLCFISVNFDRLCYDDTSLIILMLYTLKLFELIATNMNKLILCDLSVHIRDTRWRGWLRHCVTSRNFAGLIPDEVIGNFRWLNPSRPTMVLGPKWLVTGEMWSVSMVDNLATFMCWLSGSTGSLNFPEPYGPVQACVGIAFNTCHRED
jgi:hypothetical protein